jgi:uncharacterized protein YutE (UPF0331/DUF86 family)
MINGVIAQKLQNLDAVLIDLRSLGCLNVQELEQDWRTKRAVERSLQILVEIVIDVCQRILSLESLAPAATGRDALDRVIQMGILDRHDAYSKMVQFRNFLVHRYERVDNAILVDMVNRRLVDFEHFRNEILTYIRRKIHDD